MSYTDKGLKNVERLKNQFLYRFKSFFHGRFNDVSLEVELDSDCFRVHAELKYMVMVYVIDMKFAYINYEIGLDLLYFVDLMIAGLMHQLWNHEYEYHSNQLDDRSREINYRNKQVIKNELDSKKTG